MLVWVAVSAACGLALLSARSMAYALGKTVDARGTSRTERSERETPANAGMSRRDAAMLLIEIAMSIAIALAIVGLTAAAALPGRLLIGALLAQFAVLGALIAPPMTVQLGVWRIRPAAIALGVAQLAHIAFFLKAIQALL